MKTEFNLSDKRKLFVDRSDLGFLYPEEDVKEFIKKLKEDIQNNPNWEMCWEECIDKLAQAGMKIWLLTGDKKETAINIGYS